MNGLRESHLSSLKKLYTGKVRDIYAVDDKRLLMIATDRLSAFDVVFPQIIPNKGKILTAMANFWFAYLRPICPHHLCHEAPSSVVSASERAQIADRAVLVKRLKPLPIEAIVRGYLAGSAWQEYQASGCVNAVPLATGLQQAQALPQPLFTPSTKAALGTHDEPIDFAAMSNLIGVSLAHQVRDTSIALYQSACRYAQERGIIIADTKFEFGLDDDGQLTLMDEVLTPDSSRFWSRQHYCLGVLPPAYDKQLIRDWLVSNGWNKRPPTPDLPEEIITKTAANYAAILALLTDKC